MPHTPGPWTAKGPRSQGFYRNYGISHSSPGHDGGDIAQVNTTHTTQQAMETQDANARLIAAAPDLLAALKQLLSINPMSDYNETRDAKAVAREAIAKATGTET